MSLNPYVSPYDFDYIKIGGVRSPGVIPRGGMSGFSRGHEWDIKKGKGAHGATITYVQRPPSKGKIKFLLPTEADYDAWTSFQLLFKYDPTKKKPQAVDIFHPVLADIDVKSVVCVDLPARQVTDDGLWYCEVEFLEYFPPPKKSAVGTPSTSSTNSSSTANTPPNAQDAQQAEIAALTKQASAP